MLAYEADGGPTVRVLLGEPAPGEPLGPVEIARCAADPALPGLAPTLPPRPLVPVHGAPHMHQWLVDGSGRLGLVDFDRYALGEPELDVATFLVELETESPRAVAMAELAAATEAGFAAAGGRLDPDRLVLWTAHKRLAKVARTAAALRPDAEAGARAHLDRLDLAGLTAGPSAGPAGVIPR